MHCLLNDLSRLKKTLIHYYKSINRITIQKNSYIFKVKEKILPRRFQTLTFLSSSLTTQILAQEQLDRVLCVLKSPYLIDILNKIKLTLPVNCMKTLAEFSIIKKRKFFIIPSNNSKAEASSV